MDKEEFGGLSFKALEFFISFFSLERKNKI